MVSSLFDTLTKKLTSLTTSYGYLHNYYWGLEYRHRILRNDHDVLRKDHNVLRKDHTILDKAHQALVKSYNWSIGSINRTGQQVVTGTKHMSGSILDRIKVYGDTIAKQVTDRGERKIEDTMIPSVHMKLFNTLRKENPEKFQELASVATLILDKPLDIQYATIAYYFGDPEAVKIVDTLRRIAIQKKLKTLRETNKPIPKELEPYLKDTVDVNNPPINLSLTKLQFHAPVQKPVSQQAQLQP